MVKSVKLCYLFKMKAKPSPEYVFVGFRIPKDLKEHIERIAIKEERNLSQQIIWFLRKGSSEYEKDFFLPEEDPNR